MHHFDDVAEVESVLEHMQELVTKLPRRPGEKEARYTHLLSGMPTVSASSLEDSAESAPLSRSDRLAALESEVAQLRQEIESLKQQFSGFQKQFE